MDESIWRYGLLVTAPGETYNYSNLGYGILDYIISRIAGKDYSDFMREEVFEPLAMTRTSVQVDVSSTNDVAQMYDSNKQAIAPYDFDHRGASAVLSSGARPGPLRHVPSQQSAARSRAYPQERDVGDDAYQVVSQFYDEGEAPVDYLWVASPVWNTADTVSDWPLGNAGCSVQTDNGAVE